MKKALNAYSDILTELDKHESPTFEIEDFNHFFNVAIEQYITDNYSGFDIHQKEVDDIEKLVKYGEALTESGGAFTLPSEYRHVLGVEVNYTLNKDSGKYNTGDSLIIYPIRLSSNKRRVISENSYHKPSLTRAYYWISDGKLYLKNTTILTVSSCKLDYIKKHPSISVDLSDSATNIDILLKEYAYYEVVARCRDLFLENMQSPRTQTTLQQKQLHSDY